MTLRRDWLKSVARGGAAAVAGAWGIDVRAQQATSPRPASRTVQRPALEAWESRPPVDRQAADMLEAIRARHRLPGMLGAIVKGDAVIATAATGVRRIDAPGEIRITDLIHLGSCTKAMTATLLGTLYEQGAVSPDATLAGVFPEYADRLHPDYRAVTLAQLTSHRAGLPKDVDWWRLPGRTPTEKRYALLQETCAAPPRTRPGTSYTYSNVGYVLAGLMAEQVTGMGWEELIRERVFQPLRMYSAGFGPPGAGRSEPGEQPYGHHLVDGRVESIRHDNPEVMGPAGTVHCTMLDWAKFASAHLRGERRGAKLLQPSTYRILHTPAPGEAYAGGWMAVDRDWAGGRALSHTGSNTMWYATIWLAPARDFGMLVATNQGGGTTDQACDEGVGALLQRYEAAYARG